MLGFKMLTQRVICVLKFGKDVSKMKVKVKKRKRARSATNVFVTESEYVSPPGNADYIEAKRLLRDFYINVVVPKFNTVSELEKFTRRLIQEKIS